MRRDNGGVLFRRPKENQKGQPALEAGAAIFGGRVRRLEGSRKRWVRLKYAGKAKAPEFEQARSRHFRFIRFDASHQWLSAAAISGAIAVIRQPKHKLQGFPDPANQIVSGVICSFSQPKHKLQGSGCAADRASRSDDETQEKRTDRACSNLAAFPGFH